MDDRTLTFGVSGMLWNRSLVMYDRETNTYWSHILGRGMKGDFEGQELEMLPSSMTTWAEWRRRHPDTTVLNLNRTAPRFTREFYASPAEFVHGWAVSRARFHVSYSDLRKAPVRNFIAGDEFLVLAYSQETTEAQLFSSLVDGRDLDFLPADGARMRDEQTGTLWDRGSGEALEGPLAGKRLEPRLSMISYRKAWLTFYPNSREVSTKP